VIGINEPADWAAIDVFDRAAHGARTGQFNFAVEEAYLIENGQLTKPVKGATLIGEAKEVMPRISMCANDLELAAGFCGSVSGSIFVTVGQPHIKVDSITVGGR
jgi:TldD protein